MSFSEIVIVKKGSIRKGRKGSITKGSTRSRQVSASYCNCKFVQVIVIVITKQEEPELELNELKLGNRRDSYSILSPSRVPIP